MISPGVRRSGESRKRKSNHIRLGADKFAAQHFDPGQQGQQRPVKKGPRRQTETTLAGLLQAPSLPAGLTFVRGHVGPLFCTSRSEAQKLFFLPPSSATCLRVRTRWRKRGRPADFLVSKYSVVLRLWQLTFTDTYRRVSAEHTSRDGGVSEDILIRMCSPHFFYFIFFQGVAGQRIQSKDQCSIETLLVLISRGGKQAMFPAGVPRNSVFRVASI